MDLKKVVGQFRVQDTMIEQARTGDHRANGEAEKGVQEVMSHARALRIGIGERLGQPSSVSLPVFLWLVEYAGFL